MNEESYEDIEVELWVGMIGGIGDEIFGKFVEGDGDGCL